jgi:serine/threonine protein kinase
MAVVYLAHDPRFGRDVALKVLNQTVSQDDTFRSRFEREARTIATLEHPAIVPVYDFGTEEDTLYLVMRYMPGGTLAERIQLRPLSLPEIIAIARRISSALDHAHLNGVVHRDLKPGNILFDQYENAFLSDFGIVKLAQESVELTGSGVIGTPAYMSPEQIHGEHELDGRSDVYTLGIILYECMTGRKPYRADTPVKQMMAHVLEPVPNILEANPNLPLGCDPIIRRALAKDRNERFANAAALTQALTQTLSESATQGPDAVRTATIAPADTSSDEASSDEATATAVEPPILPAKFTPVPAKLPPAVQMVTPPPVQDEPPTHVGSAALAFGRTPPESAPPIQPQPEPAPARRGKGWLWLVGLLVLLLITAVAIYTFWPEAAPPETAVEPDDGLLPEPAEQTELPPTPTNAANPVIVLLPTETAVTPTAAPQFIQIGQSVNGTPIEAVQFGTGERVVILVGGLHAGFAPGSVTLANEMIAHFTENLDQIPAHVRLLIVPNANPDSPAAPGRLEGRLNAHGVDLNRNWDCRWLADPPWAGAPLIGAGGTAPFSEPEVAALADFIVNQQAAAVVFWQARSALGLASPGGCAEESEASRPLALRYGNAADYQVADFEEVVAAPVNGDATNYLDSQGIPAISVLQPDYGVSDFARNLAGVTAVLQWVADAEP